MTHRLWRQGWPLSIGYTVQAEGYTFGSLLLAQRMNINGFTEIYKAGCLGMLVANSCQALLLAQTCPVAVDRIGFVDNGARHACLLATVVVSELYDTEGQCRVLPQRTPSAHQLTEIVAISSRIARVRLTLIPDDATQGIGCQGIEHGIIQCGGHILQTDVTTGARRHVGTHMLQPLVAQRDDILRHGILTLAVGTETEHVRLLRNKVGRAIFINKADGDNIVALTEQSLGDIVATGRILVVGASHLLTIDIGDVGIKQCTQQQTGRLSGMCLVYLDVLAQPYSASTTPPPVVLVDGLPRTVIAVEGCEMSCDTRILLVQQLVPTAVSQIVSPRLGSHILLVIIKTSLLQQLRMVFCQTVCWQPCLDGCTAPAIDDDTLRHLCFLLHAFAQERTQGRKQPGILLGQRFPIDIGGTDIVLHAMSICLVLDTEQTDLIVVKMVDFIDILRIDTLYGYVDIRLARTEPHVAYQHICEFLHFSVLTTHL